MNNDTIKKYQDEMFNITHFNNDLSFKVELNPAFKIDYIETDLKFNNEVVKTEQVMGVLNWDDYDHEKELPKMREEFIQSVKSNSKPKVTFEDGRNALILANAAYDSHNNKKVVSIDFS